MKKKDIKLIRVYVCTYLYNIVYSQYPVLCQAFFTAIFFKYFESSWIIQKWVRFFLEKKLKFTVFSSFIADFFFKCNIIERNYKYNDYTVTRYK